MSCVWEFLQSFSVFVVGIQLVFGVFRWIYGNIVGPNFLEPTNFGKYGKWALVTGATDGIGKQYARSLAKRGLNIILVSRTLNKLKDVAKEIAETFNVETQVIAVNFTSGSEIYDQIKQQIGGKEIGILVNNVGMFYPSPGPEFFLNIADREKVINDIIKCNVTSVPMMCSLILPQMVQRKSGLIINISSIASTMPGPNTVLYSASKAFVTKFSDDLAAEYESQGIDIQVLITGPVSTNMNKMPSDMKGSTFMAPTPNKYVESALRFVGYARHTTGFLPHSFILFFIQFLYFIAPSLTERLMKKQMKITRDKEIEKIASTAAQ